MTEMNLDLKDFQLHFAEELICGLNSLHEDKILCDITLKVGTKEFKAHRVVLAALSEYFRAMFTVQLKESKEDVIELKDISITPESFQCLLDYCYSAELDLTIENVFEILAVAHHLSITSAMECCCDFIKQQFDEQNFHFDDFVKIAEMAETYSLVDLKEVADHYIAENFVDVSNSDDFLEYMSSKRLCEFLNRRDLAVPSELLVLKAVQRWLMYDKEKRLMDANVLLRSVRLGFISAQNLVDQFNEDIKSVSECHKLFNGLMQHHAVGKPISGAFPLKNPELFAPRGCTKSLIAIGGRTSMSCVRYYDVNAHDWVSLKNFAQPPYNTFTNHGITVVHHNLYIAGGQYYGSNKWQTRNYVYKYDASTNKWQSLAAMKVERSYFGLVNLDGFIYAIGGLGKDGQPTDVVERYNIATNKWQIISALQSPRYDMAIAVFAGKIVIIGGQSSKTDSTEVLDVEVFDPKRNQWEVKSKPLTCRNQGSTIVVDDTLYVAGGSQESSNDSATGKVELCNLVEEYNSEHDSWSTVSQSLIPKNEIGAFRINSHVYFSICNHCYNSNVIIPQDEVYDVDLDDWIKLKQNTNGAAVTEFTFNVTKLK
ncbi:kelch-like protein 28 [Saccoglossus kowalevskii]|uniref:Kelch-like protein 5-like n=1 Tax=Saccoglossus kowalevskii TaxID=10224 RepID=A0ABM0LVZ4_SACKO|nr:PREDICTED: kelch-like protein 5-like [Saccoglossus kowalevskii]